MEESKKEAPTYPYPLRSSELVGREDFFVEVKPPIPLTIQERRELLDFDQELFKRFEPLRKLSPGVHTIYPDYFLTDKGWRLFQLAYLDSNLKERMEHAEEEGFSLKKKKEFYDAVFDELEEAAANEDNFVRYKKRRKQKLKR